MRDETTLGFYEAEADVYARREQPAFVERLHPFLARLKPQARILELGCGAGQDSEAMMAQDFAVTPTDGSPALARLAAQRLGCAVRVLLFEDIAFEAEFDGVWANASLLHVPKDNLPAILGKIHRALTSGGVFFASYKAGEADGRDRFDRYFNYANADALRRAYDGQNWAELVIEEALGSGYDQKPTQWLYVTAVKAA